MSRPKQTRATLTKRRGCDGKRRHADRAAALAHMWAKARTGAHAPSLNVYRCPHCGCFHVGHRPGNTRSW